MFSLLKRGFINKLEQAYRIVFTRFGSRMYDLILIVEFPKSGGTWLGQLVSGYFDLPFPRNEFPKLGKALIHSHYLPHPSFRNTRKILWLVRDGRDVMVSQYHQLLIWNEKNRLNPSDVLYHRKRVPFSDYEDKRGNLPSFIEYVFNHKPSKLWHYTHPGDWVSYNREWLNTNRNGELDITMVKYEDLLEDTVSEMTRVLNEEFLLADINRSKLEEIVDYYSFENQTRREKGEEASGSFLRKGISGDWKNYFTPEAAETFDRYAGDMLVELGYETDHSWKDEIREPA